MLDEEGRKSLKEGIYMQTKKVTRDVISGVKGFKSIYLFRDTARSAEGYRRDFEVG
jgi:hypothetical protein